MTSPPTDAANGEESQPVATVETVSTAATPTRMRRGNLTA
jgi:hypothetical protein